MKESTILVLFVILFATLTVFGQASKSTQDQQACEYARKNNSAEIWQNYLKRFPQGMCAFEAESEIKKLGSNNQNKIGGLQWSNRSSNVMNWYTAVQYCRNLREGGYSDWRLPNIDELRTTIKNCSKSETSGECKVSERSGCLSGRCHEPIDSCTCKFKKNNNSGYYSKLGDSDGVYLWSSSTRSDYSNSGAWYVNFSSGSVYYDYESLDHHVRCVR